MHQRMHHLDTICKSYEGSKFLIDVLKLFFESVLKVALLGTWHIWMSLPYKPKIDPSLIAIPNLVVNCALMHLKI